MKNCNSQEIDTQLPKIQSIIALVVSQASGYGARDGDIEAMDLQSKREIYIKRDKAPEFIADCIGWSDIVVTYDDGTTFDRTTRFEAGYGVVLTIRPEDWEEWLLGFELVDREY
ncbi:MAG: hypothetical protein WBA76_09600 [Phormidesmis sp.]